MSVVKKGKSSKKTLGAVTPEDFEKLRQLRKMQAVALWLLFGMAVVFAVSFGLQDRIPFFGFVRAASEGGMVGAIADWFAVTALFRHPLGLKIPHTNLIARKKDDIGEGLGSFIEENFLADDVVFDKLTTISGARRAGEWLSNRRNSEKVNALVSEIGLGALEVMSDSDVQEFFETMIHRHIVTPDWTENLGLILKNIAESGEQETIVDILADHLGDWLRANPESFDRIVSSRLPSWVPSFANRFVDKKFHAEAIKFLDAVRKDTDHPLRTAVTKMLIDLAEGLQTDPAVKARVENFKHEMFTSARVRQLAFTAWLSTKQKLFEMLQDPNSELRERITRALQDGGSRLADDPTLQYKIDVWVINAVTHLMSKYRHDLANVVTDTVKNWDATEAAEKIELQVGKDLQFIRINGTVVGSLAGLAIYSVATLIKLLL